MVAEILVGNNQNLLKLKIDFTVHFAHKQVSQSSFLKPPSTLRLTLSAATTAKRLSAQE